MNVTTLTLTIHDPIIARDGRPFGAGQGHRMHSLSWPLPSTIAGALRTALVQANSPLDFTGAMPQQLLTVEVAGPFPASNGTLFLPSPADCVWNYRSSKVFRVVPVPLQEGEGVDVPVDGLLPVRLTDQQAREDFKPATPPGWWPLGKYAEWLSAEASEFSANWFGTDFLNAASPEIRDHVCLDAKTGAAAEGQLFSTVGLNIGCLSRFGVDRSKPFQERCAALPLSVRVIIPTSAVGSSERLNGWHSLGGERRLVHWQRAEAENCWSCPDAVRTGLRAAQRVRMVLATPAIFQHGWRPAWLDAATLRGRPFQAGPELKLVGVTNPRWKAVSGWAYQTIDDRGQLDPHGRRGPKPIRRMVPAGSVYFFECEPGAAAQLAERWLQSVSDDPQDQRDGFGLALWGTW